MKLDYPLKLINSKLPRKQSFFYLKLLIGLFLGNIGLLFILLMAGANETTISLIIGSVGALIFVVFFAFCLAKLYNDERDGRDFVSVYMPSLTASPTFNTTYGWLKHFSRFFLIVFSYFLLIMSALVIGSLVYASIKS